MVTPSRRCKTRKSSKDTSTPKGSHVVIDPKEIDERFVDNGEIDTRYWKKPYYLRL
jgi:non-homologous end joining protein Ku